MKITFDLQNLENKIEIEGITDFNPTFESFKRDIVNSRGEFVGYISIHETLTLFRDKVGARNLYYKDLGNKILVSTNILELLENSLLKPEYILDYNYIKHYLEFQVPFDDRTIYKEIRKVMPGELATFIKSGYRKRIKYWDLEFKEERFDPITLYKLIVDAVEFRRRLLSESYTCYVSGGIDSSSVACIVNPKEYYSGIYDDEKYSELNYIKALTEEKKRDFFWVSITEEKFYSFLTQLPWIISDPMCGLGIIPQLIVAMQAFKKGYFYSFTGEGGDEVFYGYPWNTIICDLAKIARDKFLRDKYMVEWENMVHRLLSTGFSSMVASFIARGDDLGYHINKITEIWDKNEPVENNVMKFNIKIGLPAILTVDECVGKYSKVVPLSPLADHKIIEYVASINPEERTRIPKYLLREAMEGVLPDKIRTRYDKMGFPVPVEKWKWPMIPSLIDSLSKRNIINSDLIGDLGKKRVMDRSTWALVNIEMICKMLETMNERKTRIF